MRTPLNGCLASAEMLLETQLADEQRELANTIRVSGSILLSTVSNFLDFFKVSLACVLPVFFLVLPPWSFLCVVSCLGCSCVVGQPGLVCAGSTYKSEDLLIPPPLPQQMEAGKALDIVRCEVDLVQLVSDVHCIIEAMVGRSGEVGGWSRVLPALGSGVWRTCSGAKGQRLWIGARVRWGERMWPWPWRGTPLAQPLAPSARGGA